MKKLVSILLILTLAFSLTACDLSLDSLKEKIGIKKDDDKESSVIQLKLWTSATDYIMAKGDSYCISNNEAWEPARTSIKYVSIKNTASFDLKCSVNLKTYDITKNIQEVILYSTSLGTTYGGIQRWEGSDTFLISGINRTDISDLTLKSGDEFYFAIAFHMDEAASNKYANGLMKIDVEISGERYENTDSTPEDSESNISENDEPLEGPLIDFDNFEP
ncbi:MAG: hypothetical protein E7673_03325 [Ruminococcaceae bacterium]|nr:hypothetical protein [Oscillospiraceae bacterium]